jgi:hypothetical protein
MGSQHQAGGVQFKSRGLAIVWKSKERLESNLSHYSFKRWSQALSTKVSLGLNQEGILKRFKSSPTVENHKASFLRAKLPRKKPLGSR